MTGKYLYYLIFQGKNLFAYTDTRSIYKEFKKTRDMKLFHVVKQKLTKDEVNNLAIDYKHNILKWSKMITYDEDLKKKRLIDIVCTWEEQQCLESRCVMLRQVELYKLSFVNPSIFKKDIIEALNLLKYVDCFNYIGNKAKRNQHIMELEDSMIIDELRVFINLFGDTLRKE